MRKKILSAIVFGLLVTAKPVCAATESFNYFQVVMIQPSNDDPDPEYSFPHRTPDGVQGAYFCNESYNGYFILGAFENMYFIDNDNVEGGHLPYNTNNYTYRDIYPLNP